MFFHYLTEGILKVLRSLRSVFHPHFTGDERQRVIDLVNREYAAWPNSTKAVRRCLLMGCWNKDCRGGKLILVETFVPAGLSDGAILKVFVCPHCLSHRQALFNRAWFERVEPVDNQ